MSTIKVTNIQDTSGGSSSTSEQIAKGRAKAWVNFDGTGTIAIRILNVAHLLTTILEITQLILQTHLETQIIVFS